MEYKYEPILGDQSKFNGTSESVLAIIQYGKDDFVWLTDINKVPEVEGNLIALRRIIPEPKRWTRADMDAGRLPEVGAFVLASDGLEYEFVGESVYRGKLLLRHKSGNIFDLDSFRIKPIETPEEKAQREEDEFVDSIVELLVIPASSASVGLVKHTARAAYRKLKGGE